MQELSGIWHVTQVGALLRHQNLEARIWGAQAFAAYVHTQVLSHAGPDMATARRSGYMVL